MTIKIKPRIYKDTFYYAVFVFDENDKQIGFNKFSTFADVLKFCNSLYENQKSPE